MDIGGKVSSKMYKANGIGTILAKRHIFDEIYFDVYFPEIKETVSAPVADLTTVETPTELLAAGGTSDYRQFLLQLIASQIEAHLTQHEILSANNFRIIPLPHQLISVSFVIDQFKPRCLIADEVGLGKTIEAVLVYEELALRGMVKRVLVVAPSGLTLQWRDELLFKFGEEFRVIDSYTFRTLQEAYGPKCNVWLTHDKVITSLDFVKPRKIAFELKSEEKERREAHNSQVFDALASGQWDMVIIDEAHKLAKKEHGGETARFKLAERLSQSVPIFLLLTATPHQGDSEKFLHLLSLIDPYRFHSLEQLTHENVRQVTVRNKKRGAIDFDKQLLFKQRITSTKEIDRRSPEDEIELRLYQSVSEYVRDYYKLAERENNRTFIFLLMLYQRMVSSSSKAIYDSLYSRLTRLVAVGKSMAEKGIESQSSEDDITDIEELDAQSAYDTLRLRQNTQLRDSAYLRQEIATLEKCVDLARRAWQGRVDRKAKHLLEIIYEVIRRENNPSVKFLVFTEFVATQTYLVEVLESNGFKVACLNGRMNQEERLRQKKRFSDDYQILISTDAGGEGINLQFCHVVINFDLPWNPMKIEQRIGRIDRIGQSQIVLVFNLVLKETVEQHVRQILQRKLEAIAEEFGEDKTNDILSTLHEDFNFDKIFMMAVTGTVEKTKEIEKIANDILDRARSILEKDEMLLPFTRLDFKTVRKRVFQIPTSKIEFLVRVFLELYNSELHEYQKEPRVFYFDCPPFLEGFPVQFRRVAFDNDVALNDEAIQLLTINNSFVKAVIEHIRRRRGQVSASSILVEDSGLTTQGLIALYEITFANPLGERKTYVECVFVDENGRCHSEASHLFDQPDKLRVRQAEKLPFDASEVAALVTVANEEIERRMYPVFQEEKLAMLNRSQSKRELLEKYYLDKEKAIDKIAIENIRESKRAELIRQHESDARAIDVMKNLVPSIDLIYVVGAVLK
jgi:superfamily II DNA or RNA helicase